MGLLKSGSGACVKLASLPKLPYSCKMFISNLVNKIINTGLNCKKNTWLIIEYDYLLVQEKREFAENV